MYSVSVRAYQNIYSHYFFEYRKPDMPNKISEYSIGCEINSERYDENQVVPSPTGNACEICRCVRGNVLCLNKRCTQVACSHPTRDQCCDVCDGML